MIDAIIRALPPGSAPWLLAAEVRLGLRGMGGNRRSGIGSKILFSIVGFGAALGVILAGLTLGAAVAHWPIPITPIAALIVDAAVIALFSLMLSQTINLSVQALFERGDLDLLLSSPLKSRIVLSVRAVAIVVVAAILYVALVTPFIVTASVLGRPQWLSLFVILIALAMAATAVGIVVTMALFALIGPRRTRVVAQVMAALVGGLIFLLSQAYNLTRGDDDGPSSLAPYIDRLLNSGLFSGQGMLAFPLRALAGAPVPILTIGLGGLVLLVAVIQFLGPRFASNAAESVGTSSPRRKTPIADRPFAEGLNGVMVRKELRLLARDPQLISQVLLRMLYMLPLGFVLYRNADSAPVLALGAAAVAVMAGQVAGSFAWITISAEDAPDLLRSAPIAQADADRAKLIAALVPTLAMTAIAVAALAILSPLAGAVVFVGAAASAVCSGLIQVWLQKPATRKSFNQRRRSSFFVALAEFIIQACWGAATGMAMAGVVWAFAPAVLAVLATLALRHSPERRAPTL